MPYFEKGGRYSEELLVGGQLHFGGCWNYTGSVGFINYSFRSKENIFCTKFGVM